MGRLCEWVEDPAHPADAFSSFGAYQRTLKLHCEEGQPAIVQWTPDQSTPDTVYYQVRIMFLFEKLAASIFHFPVFQSLMAVRVKIFQSDYFTSFNGHTQVGLNGKRNQQLRVSTMKGKIGKHIFLIFCLQNE